MNNPIGLQVGYWQGTSAGQDLPKLIELTHQSGADIIEVSLGSFTQMPIQEIRSFRQACGQADLRITANGGLVTPQNDISSADPSCRQAGFDHCRTMLDICAELGSPTWSGLIHSAWLLRPDPSDPVRSKAETRARSVEGMQRVASMAEVAGVVCCLEIVNRYEQFVFNTVAEGVEFCRDVDSPSCKLLLDTFHMSIEENNTAKAIRLGQEQGEIGYIHVGETNRRLPTGEDSNILWQDIATVIRDCGYEGPLILEPLELANSPAASKVCVWRSFSDPADLVAMLAKARRSIEFLRKL